MEKLKRFRDRANLLWISALEKEISIKEIASVWNYKSHIPLYKDKLPQLLLDSKLWKIVRIENREAKYLSTLDGYFDFLKLFPKVELIELIMKDKEKFKEFFEKEEIRKSLFSLEAIKIFFKNNAELAQKLAHSLPILSLSEVLAVMWFTKNNYLDEKSFQLVIPFFSFFSGINPSVSIPEYCENIFSKIKIENLKEWEYLLNTSFGKHISKEIEKKLNNPVIKRLLKSLSKF